jgi:hypothetical protein
MHQISINIGNIVWALFYKTEERAVEAWLAVKDRDSIPMLELQDDFGQTLQARSMTINGGMFENLDISKGAAIERSLHQARLQHEVQYLAENDAVLRAHRRGPAIMSPFPMAGGINGRG